MWLSGYLDFTQARGNVPTTPIGQDPPFLFSSSCPLPSSFRGGRAVLPQSSRLSSLRVAWPSEPRPAPLLARRRTPPGPRRQVGDQPPALGGSSRSAPHGPPRSPPCEPGWPETMLSPGEERPRACWFFARAFPGTWVRRVCSRVPLPDPRCRELHMGSPCWLLCPSPSGFWNKTEFGVNSLLPTLELKFSMHFF